MADPQKVIDACNAAFTPINKAHCNYFGKAVATALGDTTFGPSDLADDMVDDMQNSTDWKPLGDGVAAKNAADSGQLVIAGLRSGEHSPARTEGHIAVVLTGPLANSKYPTAAWGGADPHNPPQANSSINYAWNASDRDSVHYYARDIVQAPAAQMGKVIGPSSSELSTVIEQLVNQVIVELSAKLQASDSRIFSSWS